MRAGAGKPWWSHLFFYAKPPCELDPYSWSLLGLLGATYIVNNYDLGILALALPQIQAGLHVSEERIGAVTGAIRLGVLPALVLSMLADRLGRRRLLLLTIVGFTACTFATAFCRDANDFMVLQLLARMFMYAEEMLAIVVVAEELPARARGWGIGILAAFGALGHGFAAMLYAAVESLPYGWRALYVVGLVPLFILAWLRRNLNETRRFHAHARLQGPPHSLRDYLEPVRALVVMYPGRMAALCAAVFPFWFLGSTALQFQSKFLQSQHGYGPGQVALLFVLGGLFAIVGNAVAGSLSDRLGRRRVITAALVGYAAGTALFYNVGSSLVPLAWCLMIFAYFGSEVLFAAFASELFPTSYRSTASGARSITGALAGASGLWVEGWIYPVTGSHGAAISWMVLVALLAPLVVLAFMPETATRELEDIAPEQRYEDPGRGVI